MHVWTQEQACLDAAPLQAVSNISMLGTVQLACFSTALAHRHVIVISASVHDSMTLKLAQDLYVLQRGTGQNWWKSSTSKSYGRSSAQAVWQKSTFIDLAGHLRKSWQLAPSRQNGNLTLRRKTWESMTTHHNPWEITHEKITRGK